MSRRRTPVMLRLLMLGVGLALGVVIGLSLIYNRREPDRAPAYREDDDGVQPPDPYLYATSRYSSVP